MQQAGPEPFKSFIPAPLPPSPSLEIDADLQDLIEKANRALGRLDSISILLPDPNLFLYMFIRKEAVLSSQIEGTQSSLSDLLLFETDGKPETPIEDVKEVSNYIAAMQHGLARLKDGFPLSLRLIREIHEILLSGTRGGDKTPGRFRTSQNWVGGSRPGNAIFVPPPPQEIMACMGDLEKFLHDQPVRMPLLIKAGLAHVQFESIHPFLDGNGRVGRLLITFMLCAEEALSEPLLYLSLYFKRNRDAYYDELQRVRKEGTWEKWLRFYLEGVREVSSLATDTARRIVDLFAEDRGKIQLLGRAAPTTFAVHELLKQKAMISVSGAAQNLQVSKPTARAAIERLQKLGMVHEVTGKSWGRLFAYTEYLSILREGTVA